MELCGDEVGAEDMIRLAADFLLQVCTVVRNCRSITCAPCLPESPYAALLLGTVRKLLVQMTQDKFVQARRKKEAYRGYVD